MRIVATIVGIDSGIIVGPVTCWLNIMNILNINQNITDDFFNMVLIGDMEQSHHLVLKT